MPSFVELFNEAFRLFENKDFQSALVKLAEADEVYKPQNKQNIDRDDIFMLQGSIYFSMNDIVNAKSSFEQALKQNPASSEACLGLGEILYREGDKKGAKTMFEWGVKNDESNTAAKTTLGRLNKELGLPTDHFNSDTSYDDFETYIQKAYEYFHNRDFYKAINQITMAEDSLKQNSLEEKFDENMASLHNFKGFNYLAVNDLSSAREQFEKSLSINPNSSQACAGLGEIFFISNRDEEAKVMYEWAVENNPENQMAIAGLQRVNKTLGLPVNHNTLFQPKSERSENTFYNLISEAYDLFNKRKYSESIEKLTFAQDIFDEKELNGKDKNAIVGIENMKGFNYLSLHKLNEAKSCFEKALESNKTSSQACAGLGEIFYLTKNDREAKTMFEWGVKNNPSNQFAVAGLIKVNRVLNLPDNDNSLN